MLNYYLYSGDLFPVYYYFSDYPVKYDKFTQVKKGVLLFDFEGQGFRDEFENLHSKIKIFSSDWFDEGMHECSVMLNYNPLEKFPIGLEFYCYFGDTYGWSRSPHPNNYGVYEVGDKLKSNCYCLEIKAMGDPFIPHDFISKRMGMKIINNQLWIVHAGDREKVKEVWISLKKEKNRLFIIFNYVIKS